MPTHTKKERAKKSKSRGFTKRARSSGSSSSTRGVDSIAKAKRSKTPPKKKKVKKAFDKNGRRQ